jgi:exopolysaccharide production protein ExoY
MNSPRVENNLGETFPPNCVPTCVWKRTLDVVLVVLVLPLLLPVMSVIAVLICIVSPGPVLFRQERVGYRGQRFMLFKFRTMVLGADPGVHVEHLHNLLKSDVPMIKKDVEGDSRVIPLGSILRSSGLDELPQVINVLLGEMSLVGPRPCLPFEYDKYLPWQRERFDAVPGLTGLWQVGGKNRTTFVEMVQLDIKYARNQSVWLDLKIILKTIPALIVQMQDDRTRKKLLAEQTRSKPATFTRGTDRSSLSKKANAVPLHTVFSREV